MVMLAWVVLALNRGLRVIREEGLRGLVQKVFMSQQWVLAMEVFILAKGYSTEVFMSAVEMRNDD